MGTEFKTITEEEFDERFKPEEDANGQPIQWCWTNKEDMVAIKQAAAERRLWTALSGDSPWALVSGFHVVNRLYYVITAVPYPEGEDFEVTSDLQAEDDLDGRMDELCDNITVAPTLEDEITALTFVREALWSVLHPDQKEAFLNLPVIQQLTGTAGQWSNANNQDASNDH